MTRLLDRLPSSPTPYLIFWLVINLIQAFFTELIHDEAYYWMYGTDLDWGYFDHPPAIAILVKAGYVLFQNELGVRLWIVISGVLTLWLLYKIIQPQHTALFFTVAFSCVIMHVGGFIAVPDIPLVLFSVAFFYFYRAYLEKDSWKTALILVLMITGMAYSKYHGALVVFFAFLGYIKVARRWTFWMIPVLVLLLLIPHLYWQYSHDFPTFQYQLRDRSKVPYTPMFFVNYILGQLLVFGPLISILLFGNAVRYKTQGSFERVLKVCFYGFFGFFLIQSFRGRIEPNWTVMAILPLLYLGYRNIEAHQKLWKWVVGLAIPSLILIFVFRIFMMVNFLPPGVNPRNEFHGWDNWAEKIAERAGDMPVVFFNTFQSPSKYMFYSGKFAHAVNDVTYAGKQYDLMIEEEEKLQGQTVVMLKGLHPKRDTITFERQAPMGIDTAINFRYYNRVKIDFEGYDFEFAPDSTITLPIQITNPTAKTVRFDQNPKMPVKLEYCLFWYGKRQTCATILANWPLEKLDPGEVYETTIQFKTPKEPGEDYRFRLGIRSGWFIGRNSNFRNMVVR